jgi:hypothetical protein
VYSRQQTGQKIKNRPEKTLNPEEHSLASNRKNRQSHRNSHNKKQSAQQ